MASTYREQFQRETAAKNRAAKEAVWKKKGVKFTPRFGASKTTKKAVAKKAAGASTKSASKSSKKGGGKK